MKYAEVEGIFLGKIIRITENKTQDVICIPPQEWEYIRKVDPEYILLFATTIHTFDGKIRQ